MTYERTNRNSLRQFKRRVDQRAAEKKGLILSQPLRQLVDRARRRGILR